MTCFTEGENQTLGLLILSSHLTPCPGWSWRSDRRAQFPKHPQVSQVGGQRWQAAPFLLWLWACEPRGGGAGGKGEQAVGADTVSEDGGSCGHLELENNWKAEGVPRNSLQLWLGAPPT